MSVAAYRNRYRVNRFQAATQPEVMKVSYKYEEYKDLLKAKIVAALELFFSWLITRSIIEKYDEYIKVASGVLYFGVTWLKGAPTLGEEYSGLRAFSLETLKKMNNSEVSPITKIFYIIAHMLLPLASSTVLRKLYNRWKNRQKTKLPRNFGDLLLRVLPEYQELIHKIFRTSLGFFLLRGNFYRFSEMLVEEGYNLKRVMKGEKYEQMGKIMLLQNVLEIVQWKWELLRRYKSMQKKLADIRKKIEIKQNDGQEKDDYETDDSDAERCQVCLEGFKNASATPCGHVFCWECVIKSCIVKSECPSCRTSCKPNEIVQLRNYLT